MQQSHDESDEKYTVSSFRFNPNAGIFAKNEIDLQIEALKMRIENIVNKFPLKGMPVIEMILSISHDKEELIGLSKGLGRVAELVGPLEQLEKRREVLDIAESDPNWLAWAFGDFDSEVDEAINNILSTKEG
jgi:hypothetical protein